MHLDGNMLAQYCMCNAYVYESGVKTCRSSVCTPKGFRCVCDSVCFISSRV